jgi:hypothetical protein
MPATTARRPPQKTLARRIPASVLHGSLVGLGLLLLLAGGIAAVHSTTGPTPLPAPTSHP